MALVAGKMRGLYKVVAYLAFAALLGWLWWLALGEATSPRLPPPRRVVEVRRVPPPSPPQAKFDLEEFRWRYEDGAFRWR